MNTLKIDLDKKINEFKPLNGVNCAPYVINYGGNQSLIKECFKELNVPYSRLHDVQGAYGGTYFVDVPNIFRDFDADENDEKNYDFYYSDEYITAIVNSGAKIYYRLGVTIEWGSKKYTTVPPKDFYKWARICEHIILHYNKGWANGFEYGIEYWEIWNEPENPASMWTGTKEQFFDLYRIASEHLKKAFPEIKIGGYGSCGFYAVTSRKDNAFFKKVLQFFYDFIDMVKKEKLPLDFYSWHIYTPDVKELVEHAKFVREYLDKNGLVDTESHLNEWNVGGEGGGFHLMRNMTGASFILSALCEMQKTGYVDFASYYCFSYLAKYNGLFDLNVGTKTCTYYALKEYGEIVGLKNQIETTGDCENVYCAGGNNGGVSKIIVVNFDNDDEVFKLTIKGVPHGATVTVSKLYADKMLVKESVYADFNGQDLTFNLEKQGVAIIDVN